MSNGVNKLKMGQNLTFKFNLTLKIKVDHPHRDPNQGVLHLWSKFGDPSLNGRWVIMRTSSWLIHTHTDPQAQAMTIPEGQNWPRVKNAWDSFSPITGHFSSITHCNWVTSLTRGLSAYTARSSFKLFSIATNACMWMLAKQGERRIRKVIKGLHLMQFAQHIHLLFWAKYHFHLKKKEARQPN